MASERGGGCGGGAGGAEEGGEATAESAAPGEPTYVRSGSRDMGNGVVTPSCVSGAGPGWDASPTQIPAKPVCHGTELAERSLIKRCLEVAMAPS